VTARTATLSFTGIWHAARATEQPHFVYYLLMSVWFSIIGGPHNHWLARFPSVVFMAAAVAVLTLLGTRLFGRVAGLVAGLTLATNFHLLHWEQFARSMTLTLLLIISSTYAFVRALEAPDSRRWRWSWAALLVAACWINLFAICVLAGQLAAYLVYIRGRPRTPTQLHSDVAVAAVALAAIIPNIVLVGTANNGQLDWIPAVTLHRLVFQTYAWAGRNLVAILAGLVALALLARAWLPLRARMSATSDKSQPQPWKFALLAAWVASPFVLTLGLSAIQNAFDSHYLYPATPALALLVGAAISLAPKRFAVGLATLMLIGASLEVARYYATAPYGSLRSLF